MKQHYNNRKLFSASDSAGRSMFADLRSAITATTLLAVVAFSEAAAADGNNYKLRPNDTISMEIYLEPDMNNVVRVAGDGTVRLPLLGPQHVAGKTLPEVREELSHLYDRDYFVNPQISLSIVEYAQARVRVRGKVNKPGFVLLPPEETFTLLDVIAAAGDVSPKGNPKRVELHRIDANGKTRVHIVNLAEAAAGNEPSDLYIQDNDVVFVPEKLF